MPGARHPQPDRAEHVLDHGRAEDRVVDVVGVRGHEVVVALRPGLVVAVAEEHELELGADVGVPPALGQAAELAAQDLARRGRRRAAVLPLEVGDDEHRPLEPRHPPQRRQVGAEHEVAVPGLPGGHGEALHRVHLHVDGEQVVAPLGPVAGHLVDEEGRVQSLPRSRPCMSVITRSTVSIAPDSTSPQLVQRERHVRFIYCRRDGSQAPGDRHPRLRCAGRVRPWQRLRSVVAPAGGTPSGVRRRAGSRC